MFPLLKNQALLRSLLDSIAFAFATFFWLSYFPIAFISIFRLIRNRKVYVEQDLRRIHNDPVIIFQITTRSATKTPVVQRGVDSIVDACNKVSYYDYRISVVTDDPKDHLTLGKSNCEVVVVDSSFKTSAIKKGRALQYAVEHRRKRGFNASKYWIFHMDDESYVVPQTILALLKFIRGKKGIASEGPIFYPLKFESANRITAIAESIRPFACYDCVSQMTNPPPLHMHGSNLLIRSDIEDTIGWDFGPTLAEDQMFGFKVYEKYGQGSMGWHGGMLLEQPPLNLKDHFFQRRRWVLGTMQNMDKFPRMHKFKLMFKSITYFLGFASAVASSIYSFYNYSSLVKSLLAVPPLEHVSISTQLSDISPQWLVAQLSSINALEVGIGILLLFTSLVWLSSYQIGLFMNLKFSKIGWAKKLMLHFQTLLLSPIIGLVETFPAFYAMLEYSFAKKKTSAEKIPVYDFYVINK